MALPLCGEQLSPHRPDRKGKFYELFSSILAGYLQETRHAEEIHQGGGGFRSPQGIFDRPDKSYFNGRKPFFLCRRQRRAYGANRGGPPENHPASSSGLQPGVEQGREKDEDRLLDGP